MSAEAIQYPFTQDMFVDKDGHLTQNNIAWLNNLIATLNNFMRLERETPAGGSPQISVNLLTVSGITTAQRDLLTSPGYSIIFNTTTSTFQGYNGSAWVDLS